MMNVSAHNGFDGVYLKGSTNTNIMTVSAAHNEVVGISLDSSTDTCMMTVSAVHNQKYAITMYKCTNTSLYYSYTYYNGDGITSRDVQQRTLCTTTLEIQCT